MSIIIADKRTGDNRLVPHIVEVNLRRGYVELTVQARNNWPQPAAFFLERLAAGDVQMQGQQSQGHKKFAL